MLMTQVVHWFHLLAAILWVGGLAFSLLALLPQPGMFVTAANRFKPWMLAAMGLMVASGAMRIVEMGGFKHLPIPVHIKITLALVMIILSLISAFYFLPKATQAQAGQATLDGSTRAMAICYAVTVVLGLVILGLLAKIGML